MYGDHGPGSDEWEARDAKQRADRNARYAQEAKERAEKPPERGYFITLKDQYGSDNVQLVAASDEDAIAQAQKFPADGERLLSVRRDGVPIWPKRDEPAR